MNRLPVMHKDTREIPEGLQSYLESPPRTLPEFVLETKNKLALTPEWFHNKWSIVYFTHSNCLPACEPSLEELKSLQSAFANVDFQFLTIGLDSQHEAADNLSQFLMVQGYHFTVATGSEKVIEKLSKIFIALYLQTDFTDGSYQIEQEHHLFVVDPKGRVYATFRPPFDDTASRFRTLRTFYAKTE
jgi:cytochrome oxidase Cu insertion factor (SCO1/SenC/PrrC family)